MGVRYKTAQSVVKEKKRIKPNKKETETVTVVQTLDLLALFLSFPQSEEKQSRRMMNAQGAS